MGSDLVKALSQPFESAVHDCTQLSSESDCTFRGCCSCHTKTIAPDSDTEPDDGSRPEEAEIDIETKDTG